jgi:hypothetical protein
LVQLGEEIDPPKVLRRQATGVEVTFLGWRNQRIRVIDFAHRPISLAKQGVGCGGVFHHGSQRVLQGGQLLANIGFQLRDVGPMHCD